MWRYFVKKLGNFPFWPWTVMEKTTAKSDRVLLQNRVYCNNLTKNLLKESFSVQTAQHNGDGRGNKPESKIQLIWNMFTKYRVWKLKFRQQHHWRFFTCQTFLTRRSNISWKTIKKVRQACFVKVLGFWSHCTLIVHGNLMTKISGHYRELS